jgi:hypothetical protein
MARPETLVPGNCYFSVGFYDNDLVLPMIDTLVYVGQSDDDPDHGRMWLFKQPDASPESEQDGKADDAPALIAFSDKQLHEIVDFSGLIQRIREVAADHPLQPIPNLAAEPARADDFDTLEPEIAKFLNSAEYVSVTITIRFTDDGLSLGRRDGGYDVHFFAHPRQVPTRTRGSYRCLRASVFSRSLTTSAIAGGRACCSFRSRAIRTRSFSSVGVYSWTFIRCVAAMVSTTTSSGSRT